MRESSNDRSDDFEAERPRLVGLATRLLSDRVEAEDMVQQAWLRLERADAEPDNLAAWLTTVTTRLCLDRLRAKKPELPGEGFDPHGADARWSASALDADARGNGDGAAELVMAETVGVALDVVLKRLGPSERVAFVLHDTFGFEFGTIAGILETTPAAARQLASRARAKVRQPATEDALADWEVVDAFMAAARGGDLARLLQLLAPDVRVRADAAAITMGTPERIDGRDEVAAFFDGAAQTAGAVTVDGRPASAWIHRGEVKVLFDIEIVEGVVTAITFRADPDLLTRVVRRDGPPVGA